MLQYYGGTLEIHQSWEVGMRTRKARAVGNTGFDVGLQDVIDSVEDELLVVDANYRIRLANSAVRRRLPQGAKRLVGRHCYQVLRGENKPCSPPLLECPLEKVLQDGRAVTVVHAEPARGTGEISDRYVR